MIKEQIEALSDSCFDIEKSLKLFQTFGVDSGEQNLRRCLFKIRCDIGALHRYAEMVDEERDINEKTKEG